MTNIFKDLKFAIRLWLKRPAFAVAVVLTLAIGIGANTAIFSVVQSVLLSPLPLPESDRLVTFWISAQTKKLNEVNLTPGLFSHIRERTKTLERVAAYETRTVSFTGSGEPEQLNVAAVAVTSVLTIAALVASYIPARRAMKVDPLVALRYE